MAHRQIVYPILEKIPLVETLSALILGTGRAGQHLPLENVEIESMLATVTKDGIWLLHTFDMAFLYRTLSP